MAGGEEKKPPTNPWEPVILLVVAFAIGAAFIWQRGGFSSLKNAGGVLVAPPQVTAPVQNPSGAQPQ